MATINCSISRSRGLATWEKGASVKNFRIVSNGSVYRVERECTRGILWWKRPEWLPLRVCKVYDVTNDEIGFSIVEFSTQKEAHEQLLKELATEKLETDWYRVA